jgi:hypothetical protein
MEPLRKCQVAKQFKKEIAQDGSWTLTPCTDYPNCPYCPMALSNMSPQQLQQVFINLCQNHCFQLHSVWFIPYEWESVKVNVFTAPFQPRPLRLLLHCPAYLVLPSTFPRTTLIDTCNSITCTCSQFRTPIVSLSFGCFFCSPSSLNTSSPPLLTHHTTHTG